jgi:hypothetical protein
MRQLLLTGTGVVAAALAAAAAGFEIARMQLPAELATEADRVVASGFGGKNRGHYELEDGGGEFTRIESRFAVLDPLYAANRGKSSFTLEGDDAGDGAAAECAFRERTVTIGVVTFDPAKLAYVCDVRDGRGAALGSLALGEPRPEGFKQRMLAREQRRGVAEIGGVSLELSSVHHYEGSRLSSQVPVGYVLMHGTEPVAALELTDSNPSFMFRSGLAPEVRRAALLAALGLAVLRDPAASTLGD